MGFIAVLFDKLFGITHLYFHISSSVLVGAWATVQTHERFRAISFLNRTSEALENSWNNPTASCLLCSTVLEPSLLIDQGDFSPLLPTLTEPCFIIYSAANYQIYLGVKSEKTLEGPLSGLEHISMSHVKLQWKGAFLADSGSSAWERNFLLSSMLFPQLQLGMFTLERRQLRGDMITDTKHLKGC